MMSFMGPLIALPYNDNLVVTAACQISAIRRPAYTQYDSYGKAAYELWKSSRSAVNLTSVATQGAQQLLLTFVIL